MRRWYWCGFGLLVVAAVAAMGYVLLTPKIGHATRAEIEAVLPASLKVVDVPDPQGEARYTRMLVLAKRLTGGKPTRSITAPKGEDLVAMERILAEGPLRAPVKDASAIGFDFTTIKDAAKAIALATTDARKRGDKAACDRWAALGLEYGKALSASGGVVIDGLVHIAIESIGVRSAYLAEIDGGLDDPGRNRVLAFLPPHGNIGPTMADAMRRDYRFYMLPTLLDPKGHEKDFTQYDPFGDFESEEPPESLAGTFDPVETARMTGEIYAATIADLGRPAWQARHDDVRLIEAASKGLPDPSGIPSVGHGAGDTWAKLKCRIAMNSGYNTLGRLVASSSALTSFGTAATRTCCER